MNVESISQKEVNRAFTPANNAFDPDKRISATQTREGDGNTKESSERRYNVDKRIDTAGKEVIGGSYEEVRKFSNSETHQVHHMPADSASYLDRNKGPAIKMEILDHRQTASWGLSRDAMEYRTAQRNFINNGKFIKAVKMDIADIQGKFGSKYDKAISELMQYVNKLKTEGEIR